MNTRKLELLCAALLGALALSACSSGGGGGNDGGDAQLDATWNQTNWDEARWT